jgi:hypothetical protein
MALQHLSPEQRKLVRKCLIAAVEGPFFPDWEFHLLFSLERDEVRMIANQWPTIDESDDDVRRAIKNSFNKLLGYPHGEAEAF